MDRTPKNNGSTANNLLGRLKNDLLQNASDKETLAAEEAAVKRGNVRRYRFRVTKKADYLEKKRIAETLASAADEADISDEDLEALLRSYLMERPRTKTVVETTEETIAPEKAETAPKEAEKTAVFAFNVTLDEPMTGSEEPFFEESDPEVIAEEIDTLDAIDTVDAIDAMEDMKEMEEMDATEVMDGLDITETTEKTAATGDTDIADTDEALFELIASMPDDDLLPADDFASAPAPDASDDLLGSVSEKHTASISDAELESMLAAIESEGEIADERTPADAHTDTAAEVAVNEPLPTDEELEAVLANLPDDMLPDSFEEEIAADIAAYTDTEHHAQTDENDASFDADRSTETDDGMLSSLTENDGETVADAADPVEDGEFDQTDLDLMIAFGLEDQLEKAVGPDQATKYKKAIGERGVNHYNEMHMGDRPDTVLDKHAEYVSPAQNKDIFAEYKKKYSGMLFRFLGALFFLVLLFFFENDKLLGITMPDLFDREMYPLVYTLFDLQLVALAGAMIPRAIRTGIRAIFRGRPTPESIAGFLFLACVVYTAVIAALCPMHGLQLYNFPIALAVLFELCYEFMNLRREIMSFKVVSSKKLKYAVDAISPKDGEAERRMFAEYISDDPALFRIKRTAFVENFFARTETYPRTQRILRAVIPAVTLLILAFFAAQFMLTGNVYNALTASYITMLLTLPSCAFIMFSYPMYRASGFAYEKESAMIGEASLGEYADASVVTFDDKEVFPSRGVRVRNVKIYGNNRIDHVIYAAASVFKVIGGPLSDVFETATGEIGYSENVKLIRLDRDGIESRVDNGTTLIGRASFVNRYGYNVTLSESEKSMEETGDACILYVAYNNNITAKLYIQYAVDPDFEVVLKQLYRQGICVGIKTSDPNIDDHLLSCKIKMSKYPVKIIKCAEPKETAIIVDRLSSGIVSKASAKSLLQTLAICDRVLSASRTNNILGLVSVLLGMAAMAFFVISGINITVAPLFVALYQFFWVIPVVVVARYYI